MGPWGNSGRPSGDLRESLVVGPAQGLLTLFLSNLIVLEHNID